MKQAQITCTLGTTTDNKSVLEQMVEFGMTGVRINTAYASIEDYSSKINMVREVSKDMNTYLDIMLDIKGPQVRLGDFDFFRIDKGSTFSIDFPYENNSAKYLDEVKKVTFNKNFSSDLKVGNYLLIENGSIVTKIESCTNSSVSLKVIEPGEGIIHKYMGVNVPGVYLNVDKLSDKDKDVIKLSLDKSIDKIALSFVRDATDVKNCYDFMKSYSQEKYKNTELCLKIEDKFGVTNLDNILQYTKSLDIKTSVMVARGDLFVELNCEELPFAQDYIVSVCKKHNVPVMIGTGILSSMQNSVNPSRAEICDVYSILKSDVDSFMLAGETSYGQNPVLVVKTLNDISKKYYEKKVIETNLS